MNNNVLGMEIPETVRAFRYENMLVKYKNPMQKNCEVIFKNIEKNYHLHIYELDNIDPKSVITIEDSNGAPKKHIEFDLKKWLELLANVLEDFWKKIEIVDVTDLNISKKIIKVIDLPKQPTFNKIKRKKTAYFDQEMPQYYYEFYFDDLDTFKPQMGVIEDEKGNETDLVFIGNGQILRIPLTAFDEMGEDFESKMSASDVFKPIGNITKEEVEEIIHSLA